MSLLQFSDGVGTCIHTPAVIDRLNPGDIQTADISVVPARNTDRDGYQITVIAHANETRRITSIYLRIDAVTSIWTWIGAGIAVLVIAGFVIVFRRYGRQ